MYTSVHPFLSLPLTQPISLSPHLSFTPTHKIGSPKSALVAIANISTPYLPFPPPTKHSTTHSNPLFPLQPHHPSNSTQKPHITSPQSLEKMRPLCHSLFSSTSPHLALLLPFSFLFLFLFSFLPLLTPHHNMPQINLPVQHPIPTQPTTSHSLHNISLLIYLFFCCFFKIKKLLQKASHLLSQITELSIARRESISIIIS